MKTRHMILAGLVALATTAAFGHSAPASAQQKSRVKGETPPNFPYEIRNGRRVPKGKRVTAPDGSWREEIRKGNCVTLRQKTADGVYSETRECD